MSLHWNRHRCCRAHHARIVDAGYRILLIKVVGGKAQTYESMPGWMRRNWTDRQRAQFLFDAIRTRYDEVFPHKDFWVPHAGLRLPRGPAQTGGKPKPASPRRRRSLLAQRA